MKTPESPKFVPGIPPRKRPALLAVSVVLLVAWLIVLALMAYRAYQQFGTL